MASPEFPAGAAEWADGVSRREFVRLVGATILAATGAACGGPRGEIVPYAVQPPEVVPGVPLHYATAMELDGYAAGLVVESREGRPVKVEGNPVHPASLGAAGVFAQASVLQLYDPDRGRYITRRGADSSWTDFAAAFSDRELQRVAGASGEGLFLLLEPTASPIVLEVASRILARFPGASFCYHAPLAAPGPVDGARLAFGRELQPIYDLSNADVVLTADADLFATGPFALRYARQFADGRRVRSASDPMNRLYAIDGVVTPTGISADHRLAARPGDVVALLAALAREVLAQTGGAPAAGLSPALARAVNARHGDWVRGVAADLVAHRGRAVVVVGDRQPPVGHALGHLLNEILGAAGTTVRFVEPARRVGRPGRTDLAGLAEALRGGDVRALAVLGGNPSYTAPASMELGTLIRRVPLSLYAGLYPDQTAGDAQWYVPLGHFLESWGDARALDGTTSIVQPLIAPLFGARSLVELLAFFAGDRRAPDEIVRAFWSGPTKLGPDPDAWRDTLRSGVVPGSAATSVVPTPDWAAIAGAVAEAPATGNGFELLLSEDPSVHDGRFANNAWLQELPKPFSKLTWQNAARISPATAAALQVDTGTVLEIASGGRRVQAPAVVVPGMADRLVALAFGYGQTRAGRTAHNVGANAYEAWDRVGRYVQPASASAAQLLGLPFSESLAITQLAMSQNGRPILLESTLARLRTDPSFTEPHRGPEAHLYASEFAGRQWGMAIDLTVCTGCNACVIACQAENNVPVVGKGGVLDRREMHWLRVDRYVDVDPQSGAARIGMQPMLCQHCEDAPCEYVCPVNATVHSPDGLNEMIYNRCVGTRFCSNNCPYKVRRFNFLNYTSRKTETERMAMNPDVTVRGRGVMEKCTFCVQRIRRADIAAGTTGSDDPYARLQTACQQACPTRAIVFGAISDPGSEVARAALAPQSYEVLHELGTRPRVHYLARLRNVNPAVAEVTT